MIRYFFTTILLFLSISIFAQNSDSYFKTIPSDLSDAPEWAILMYADNPDVGKVEYLYDQYFRQNPYEKTIHTQNFKHWMMMVSDLINSDRKINPDIVFPPRNSKLKSGQQSEWKQIGPLQTYNFPEQGSLGVSWQANVYCFDQSVSQPDICFAGIEGGALYKSNDKGQNWFMVSRDVSTSTINDVKVAPSDHRIVYFTSNKKIYKSFDGGINWEFLYNIGDTGLQLLIHPDNPDIVFCAAADGFYKSTDGGDSWARLFTQKSWDVNFQPGNPDIVYLLKTNSSGNRCLFLKSTDGGETFEQKESGWYVPSDPTKANDIGGKIGVTPADPNRVYAALIGESKEGDNGWIGLYRSEDAGESWLNPNLPDGGPYNTANHPNPASINPNGTGFHQGFFNFALAVSHHNPDLLWMGTLSLNRSDDAGASFIRIGSYNAQQDIGWIHPDIQDLHVLGSDVWVCSDGGINYSTNQLQSHETRNLGLAGSNYWGFGQGWNEDVMVGGRYHNGNSGYHENYGEGNSLRLGGAEAPTGYINPQFNRKAYFSDISTQVLPLNLNGKQTGLPKLGKYPNEAYTESHSSEMEFDPRYSDHIYIGSEGKLYKSENGGGYFEALYSFGSTARVLEIEVSRLNPDVIYVVSQPGGGYWDACSLYRSEDGGITFTRTTNIPSNSRFRTEISLNPEDENELWAMSITGSDKRKVYRTLDGGQNWENMTSGTLDDHRPQDIQFQGGTDGYVYLATAASMFYYDPAQSEWIEFAEGLPLHTRALEMKPFYAKNKIRMATGGHAIWENEMMVRSRLIAQPMTQNDTLYTLNDTVSFESYSIVELEGAIFKWEFNPEPEWVSSYNVRNPKVVFGTTRSYDVSLEVSDAYGNTDKKTIPSMVTLMDLTGIDPIAGKSLEASSAGDYAMTESFDITTEVLTITAWVKPDGIQPAYSGIVLSNGQTAGMNFRSDNNTLGYHWPGGSWSWNSKLIVKPYQWSHVAIVADRDKVTLYVNGIGETHIAEIEPVMLGSFGIGSYKGWSSRNFVGMIDEVSILKKALTEEEIRLNMHLTKEYMTEDPDLLAYYQFNEPGGPVLNKVGNAHASMYGNSRRIESSAPVGAGTSAMMEVTSGGEYIFENTGSMLNFPYSGSLPDGEVVVSKVNTVPASLPNENPNSGSYWILEGYGSNYFSTLSSADFTLNEELSEELVSNSRHAKLWKRRADSDQNSWLELCGSKSAGDGSDSTLSYDASCQISGFGHFIIISDDPDFPIFRSQSTGINTIDNAEKPLVYPNPVTKGGNIRIKNNDTGKIRISIYDIDGKLVKDRILSGSDSYSIQTDAMNQGLYFYSLKTDKYIINGKIVIE